MESSSYTSHRTTGFAKVKEVAQLMKLRLSSLVVLSAGLSYLLAVNSTTFSIFSFIILIIGGVLVTGASNGFNQIIERDTDGLMPRTKDRPMPNDRLSVVEALVWCTTLGLGGIFLLWFFLNPLSGILATLALLLYVIVYTPLKKVSPWAVFVGAFPGAIPPMLGWVAATGEFGLIPGILFLVQFVWQFPHFWSIGWLSHDAYKDAGFYLLPFKGGKVKNNALITLVVSVLMIPTAAIPTFIGVTGNLSLVAAIVLGTWFTYRAWKFYKSSDDKDARKLMFATFLYLPLIQIIYVLDKI